MGLGLILGALSGAGNYVAGAANQNIKLMDEQTMNEQRASLEEKKQIAIEQAKHNMTTAANNTERARVKGVIDKNMGGLVEGAINSKYAGTAPADPSTWTQEQQAAVDMSKDLDRKRLAGDFRTQSRAAAMGGEYGAAGALDKMADSGAYTLGYGQSRYDSNNELLADNSVGKNENEKARMEAMMLKAQAALQGKSGKSLDPVKAMQIIEHTLDTSSLPPNPFVDRAAADLNGGKLPPDTTGRDAFKQLARAQLSITGTDGDTTAAMQGASTMYSDLNRSLGKGLMTYFKDRKFDNNKWDDNEKNTQNVIDKFGFDPTGMTKSQILNAARDAAMPSETVALVNKLAGDSGGGSSAPAAAAPKPPGLIAAVTPAAAAAAAAKPAAVMPETPPYTPPPGSPAAQAAVNRAANTAAMAADEKKRSIENFSELEKNTMQAYAAFNAVGNDPVKADELQTSPLFRYLTSVQKAQIASLTRGR